MDEGLQARIAAAAEAGQQESIDFLRALIRRNQDGEPAVQRYVAEVAEALGCAVQTVRYNPAEVPMVAEFAGTEAIATEARESVVARLHGTANGRSLILFAHPDSEPVACIEAWRHDPFAGVMEAGRLHGWGVADDLAGVAVMIEGLRILLASGLRPSGDIILASTPSKRHARGVSALLHGGLQADAAVYLHPAESGAGMGEIKAFAAGQLEFRIVVQGRPPDTGEPHQTGFAHLGSNPITSMFRIAEGLQVLDEQRGARVHHPALHGAVGRSTNLMLSQIAAGRPDALSRMPDRCTMGAALSFPPGETLAAVQAEIMAAVEAVSSRDPWLRDHPPEIIWDAGVSGAEVAVAHPLYKATAAAILAVTGKSPQVNPMHTSSDIRNPIVQKGIAAVGLGPLCGDLTQTGGTDEWVELADYLRFVRVAAALMATWCEAS
ncbi:M20 family metallopeptidase [Roseomonas sp. WA12]